MPKKVFVSGCFDMLHSGHVEFFREAAAYGDVYVALGSDKTVYDLKGRAPINNEEERRFMVQSVSYVKEAFVSKGSGMLDFEVEVREIGQRSLSSTRMGTSPRNASCARSWALST
jgi:cytidyltransferase-like protein